MKESILTALSFRKPIPNKLREQILDVGTITGSRSFGGYVKGESDVDVIIPPGRLDQNMILSVYGCYERDQYQGEQAEGFFSVYVRCIDPRPGILNLLFMNSMEIYNVWVQTTHIIRKMVEISPQLEKAMIKKEHRVRVFEAIKIALRDNAGIGGV